MNVWPVAPTPFAMHRAFSLCLLFSLLTDEHTKPASTKSVSGTAFTDPVRRSVRRLVLCQRPHVLEQQLGPQGWVRCGEQERPLDRINFDGEAVLQANVHVKLGCEEFREAPEDMHPNVRAAATGSHTKATFCTPSRASSAHCGVDVPGQAPHHGGQAAAELCREAPARVRVKAGVACHAKHRCCLRRDRRDHRRWGCLRLA